MNIEDTPEFKAWAQANSEHMEARCGYDREIASIAGGDGNHTNYVYQAASALADAQVNLERARLALERRKEAPTVEVIMNHPDPDKFIFDLERKLVPKVTTQLETGTFVMPGLMPQHYEVLDVAKTLLNKLFLLTNKAHKIEVTSL